MATKKRLSLIYELENFANTYLGKVTKFQVDGLFRFGVLSNLLEMESTPLVFNGVNGQLTPSILTFGLRTGVLKSEYFIISDFLLTRLKAIE